MATMISNLPRDLVEEILSRVSLKSTRSVRLTCKKWNDLSKSESFTKMHIAKTTAVREGESMMIVMTNNNLYLVSIFVDHVDPLIECKGELSCLNEQVKISNVYHCDGLLLCILKNNTITRIVVWNPYLGQTRWIEPRYSHRPNGWESFSYALGYENKKSCLSLKLLRFIDYFYFDEEPLIWYEIYDFDSDLWTTLDINNPHWRIVHCDHGVSLKGNTYSFAGERNPNEVGINHIICFDFTREIFGPLLSLPFYARKDFVSLSCVREDKLAVLFQSYDTCVIHIWITTKIDPEEVCWIKFLRVEATLRIRVPYIAWGFIIDEEKKVAIGFDGSNHHIINIIGEAGYFRQLDSLMEPAAYPKFRPNLYSYVPSCMQIKQFTRGEKKQESELEKHRHDQKMLRLLTLFKGNQ